MNVAEHIEEQKQSYQKFGIQNIICSVQSGIVKNIKNEPVWFNIIAHASKTSTWCVCVGLRITAEVHDK